MDYYLNITHAFGNMLTYYFKVSNYSLFYNVEDDNGEEVEICIDNVIGFETTEDNKARVFYYWLEEGTSMIVTETPEEVREIISAARTKKKAIKDNYVVVEKLPEDVKFQTVRLDILDRLYEREQCFMTLRCLYLTRLRRA